MSQLSNLDKFLDQKALKIDKYVYETVKLRSMSLTSASLLPLEILSSLGLGPVPGQVLVQEMFQNSKKLTL